MLAAHDEPAGPRRVAPMRDARSAGRTGSPRSCIGLGSALAGPSFTAVHMTWGAVNEWTTQAGYARLAARADHPVLTELLRRIMRQEGRHIDFYATRPIARLDGDRRAQRLTRFALRRFWRPVGSDVMPDDRGAVHRRPPLRRRGRSGRGRAHRPPHRPTAWPRRPASRRRRASEKLAA